jgi:hypothetical protein
MSDGGYT